MIKRLLIAFVLLFLAPVGISFAVTEREPVAAWTTARRDPTGLAPDPAQTQEAVIQVYAARAFAWRGIFAVHTWISMKPAGAPAYTRYEVIGWGVQRGVPAIRVDRMGPDNYWFGNYPTVLLDRRGPEAEALIPKIREAIDTYPYKDLYRTWPGPNSNTFIAHIGRAVPELGLELPNHAIGKDYLPDGAVFAAAPSGSGYQFSVLGVAGVTLALNEGVEVNLLGLSFGVDFDDVAIKLPALGRIGLSGR
ncbi:MAG TPA: DUF3750 domain-containing protein [Alphaproteobacteria bacterium]|nr:DUF3750 domain-containing protein [Alphaproteobacteria bacterium]